MSVSLVFMNGSDLAGLLDRGWEIRLFRNPRGTYTASAYGPPPLREGIGRRLLEIDGPTPGEALAGLIEKGDAS